MLLSALVLAFIMPNTVQRKYTDPDYCVYPDNKTVCVPNIDTPQGKGAGDSVYQINFECIYVVTVGLTWASGLLGGLILSVPVSGGYLNPAISLTLATMSRLEWYS